jgi:sensor histidine kinase YesM
MKHLTTLFILLFFSVSKLTAAQADTIYLNKETKQITSNGKEVYFFTKEDIDIEQLHSKAFKSAEETNFSYISGVLWVKLIIKNIDNNQNRFVLHLSDAHLSGVYIFKPVNGGYEMSPPKQFHPEDGREIYTRIPAFFIELEKGQTKTFYLKIISENEVTSFNYIIEDHVHYYKSLQTDSFIIALYWGALVLMIIINIFYYISLKDPLFLVYSFYVFACLLQSAAFEGLFWLTTSPDLAYHLNFFSIRLWPDALLFFTIQLVNLREHNKMLTRISYGFIFYHTILMNIIEVFNIFNNRGVYMEQWETINMGLGILLTCFVILRSYKNNKYLFKYYLIAYGVLLCVFAFACFHTANNWLVFEHGMKAGTLVEIVTLSFAVSRRFRLTENDLKRKKEEEHKLNEKIHDLETNVRKAQMNPHFMFNALTSIEYYILKNNRKEACLYLEEFAQLMRLTLDNSRQSYIPLEDELKALKLYVDLEFLRLKENKHEFEIKLSEAIDPEDIVVPALLIQPFVENAILHGLQKKHSSGNLIIALRFEGNNLLCIIEDDGGGMNQNKKSTHKSSGMQITKERLLLIHGIQNTTYKFEVTDVVNEKDETIGTRVLFYMPYKKD